MTPNESPFPLDGGRAGDGGETARPSKPVHLPGAITRARRLRRASTVAERLLWAELRKLNLNFRRQVPIGRYIADFAQHELRLIIEVDGPVHDEPDVAIKDEHRAAWLTGQGYRILRFRDLDVVNDLAQIVQRIEAEASPPSPTLPPSRGKGE
jgi:very-short-patch-repair endonuclease